MIFAIWYSLYNWNGYGPLSDFISLQDYQGVVTGSVFHRALVHNIIIACCPSSSSSRSASGWPCC
jgi:ABC-type sugar transport system permease subunit